MIRPQADDYPDRIERAIEALLREGLDAGATALAPIAYPPRIIRRRRRLTRSQMARVFQRDCFTCRYCNGKTVFTPVMELLGALYPDVFPFQSSNWKAGVTHPAIVSRSPAVDHVVPIAQGGTGEHANLVTACTPCNSVKADFSLEQLGWELQPRTGGIWGGLTELYRPLWDFAGNPRAVYHQSWLNALGI